MTKDSDKKPDENEDDDAPEAEEPDEDEDDGDEDDGDDGDDDDDDDDGEEDAGDDGEEDAGDEDDDDDEEPAEVAKPEPKKAASGSKATAAKKTSKTKSSKKAASKSPPSAGKKLAAKRAAARRTRKGSPTRNIVFFVLLVGGLAAAFGVLGNQGGGTSTPKPKWKEGATVDVEITVVHTDARNLNCAMKGEIKGKACAFSSENEKNTGVEADSKKNANLLQPYTTTDRIQFLAAGLWAQPALSKDLPRTRFTVKCKFVVEGKADNASVQWKPGEGWHPGNGWHTGYVKDCSVASVQE